MKFSLIAVKCTRGDSHVPGVLPAASNGRSCEEGCIDVLLHVSPLIFHSDLFLLRLVWLAKHRARSRRGHARSRADSELDRHQRRLQLDCSGQLVHCELMRTNSTYSRIADLLSSRPEVGARTAVAVHSAVVVQEDACCCCIRSIHLTFILSFM